MCVHMKGERQIHTAAFLFVCFGSVWLCCEATAQRLGENHIPVLAYGHRCFLSLSPWTLDCDDFQEAKGNQNDKSMVEV